MSPALALALARAPLVLVRPWRPKADLFRADAWPPSGGQASARRRPKDDLAGRPQSRPGPAPARAWPGRVPGPALIYLYIYLFGGIYSYGGSLLAVLAPIGSYWLLFFFFGGAGLRPPTDRRRAWKNGFREKVPSALLQFAHPDCRP